MKNKSKIYKDCYQMTISIFHHTKSYPKYYRPTLGRKLEEDSIVLTQIIANALMQPKNQKKESLQVASSKLDNLRVLLNLSKDLQILSANGFQELTKISFEVGRELGGLI